EPALIAANSQNNPDIVQTEQRIAEVAERLRAEARARAAQPAQTFRPVGQDGPVAAQPAAPSPIQAAPVQAAPLQAPQPLRAPEPVALASEPMRIELPQAPVMRDEVMLTQTQPRAAMAYEPAPMPAPEPVLQHAAGPFVPPRPAVAVARAPRMPQIQDLPLPAQAQLRAREEQPAEPAGDSKRMTLLRRLATVGFGGRREEVEAAPLPPMRAPVAPTPQAAAPADYAKRAPVMQAAPAYRPAQGNLDPQGRVAPQSRMMDDDQLEIPAFLRRQAN
ncbi:MAG: cell division protein FtsZ, partial [Methylobacterium sp.]|nr:cell division protein FtsZ [Methylobacterium sp.]